MTSILTNTAAMAALQTLRSIGTQLTQTQGQVSSGLRVQTAANNAAYWSIATTMRSDNQAISAVSDALGLSHSIVDTQYSAVTSITDALQQVKAKLVLATDASVDRSKIQDDIGGIQDYVRGVIASASFSGVNWIGTNIADMPDLSSFDEGLPSSITRHSNGGFSVGSTTVDLTKISMVNTDGGGALQKVDLSVGDMGGLPNAQNTSGLGHRADFPFSGPFIFGSGDALQFDVAVDTSDVGHTLVPVSITRATVDAALGVTGGVVSTSDEWAKVLNLAKGGAANDMFTFHGTDYSGTSGFIGMTVGHTTTGRNVASAEIQNLTETGSVDGGLSSTPIYPYTNFAAQASFQFSTAFTVKRNASFSFDLLTTSRTGSNMVQTITIDRSTVDGALGTTDGVIGSEADMAQVLTAALGQYHVDVVDYSGSIYLNPDASYYNEWGPASYIKIANARDNARGPDFDFYDIDVTTDFRTVDQYLQGLEYMLKRNISAGSYLGSVERRLGMQQDFADSLSKSIASGIGRLVDADMEEASARVTAQQTQQQLTVQSLQIANTSANAILQLYSGR